MNKKETKKGIWMKSLLQALDFGAFFSQPNITELSQNFWWQSFVIGELIEWKVNHVELDCLNFWAQPPHWSAPNSVLDVHLIHLWCKSHVVKQLLFLTWQRCWSPPVYAQRLVFNIHRANLCYHEWVSIFFQAKQAKHYHDISNPIFA